MRIILLLVCCVGLALLIGCADRPSKVPEGFRTAPGTGAEPYLKTGWPQEIIHAKTGMEMVFIPAGEFLMGSPATEEGRENGNVYGSYSLTGENDEGPQQKVKITNSFYMGKYEVTQEQWRKIMTSGTNVPPAALTNQETLAENGRLPVEYATPDECRQFLINLNAMGTGKFRLPTESEWEYACRAGTTNQFAFGETITPAQANYNGELGYGKEEKGGKGEYRRKPIPVGSLAKNAWGLYDMHGNVWERCGSLYKLYPTNAPYAETEGMDVLRGGAWYCRPGLCRSANRFQETGFSRGAGLRVVYELK
jgi:formylglycine-generating enzyme required for sulfatase activity